MDYLNKKYDWMGMRAGGIRRRETKIHSEWKPINTITFTSTYGGIGIMMDRLKYLEYPVINMPRPFKKE